jgi:circadian clock protein KaiC
MAENNLVQTGIEGLDQILLGGIPRTNVILVRGTTGTGKTLLGLEFIYRGVVEFNEPGMIVVFETSPEKLMRDAATLGWNLEELQERKQLQIVFTSPQVLEQELRSPDSLLLETATEMGAKRIFIDGIGLLRQAPDGTDMAPGSIPAYRELLQQLLAGLHRQNLTTMLSHETGTLAESVLTSEAAGSLVDTLIELNRVPNGRRIQRTIQIVKSRGQDFESGEHTLHIVSGKGLEVFRRVQSPMRFRAAQPTSTAKRSATGVAALDALIGGGLFDGSTTMVVGVSGVGKTVLGTHLLRESVAQGKPGLLISLDEHPAQIIRNADTLGLHLQPMIDDGSLQLIFESPQELDIDRHFHSIVRTVEKHNIQRMVIDGMTSYSTAIGSLGIYRDFFHALVAFSKGRLMTTIFNYENPEFLGISSFMPDFPVSSIVDNIILLSLVELESSLHRCMTVVKSRGTKHEFDSREYQIGVGGINLVPCEEGVNPPAPFSTYSSILSRAPTRFRERVKAVTTVAD